MKHPHPLLSPAAAAAGCCAATVAARAPLASRTGLSARRASPSSRRVGDPPAHAAIPGRHRSPPPPPPRPPRPPPPSATPSRPRVNGCSQQCGAGPACQSSTPPRAGRGGGCARAGAPDCTSATLAARHAARWFEDMPRRVASASGVNGTTGDPSPSATRPPREEQREGTPPPRSTVTRSAVEWAAALPLACSEAESLKPGRAAYPIRSQVASKYKHESTTIERRRKRHS